MTEVKDVMGKVVKIGDTVAFATAGRGASGFTYGVVFSFKGKKSIEIERVVPRQYRVGQAWFPTTGLDYTTRQDGCFAIVEVNDEETN